MGNKGINQEIVITILMLAGTWIIDVIAEGEETMSQATKIESLNCEFGKAVSFPNRPLSQSCNVQLLFSLLLSF